MDEDARISARHKALEAVLNERQRRLHGKRPLDTIIDTAFVIKQRVADRAAVAQRGSRVIIQQCA